MSWLRKLDSLSDKECRHIAYLLADCAERAEPVTAARLDRWVSTAKHGPDLDMNQPGDPS